MGMKQVWIFEERKKKYTNLVQMENVIKKSDEFQAHIPTYTYTQWKKTIYNYITDEWE